MFLFLSMIYTVILVIILLNSAVRFFRKKDTFNYFPLLATVMVIVVVLLASQTDKFEGSTTLYAASPNRHSLTLWKSNTFKIQMREIEWSCFYKGIYKIDGDTLSLARNDIQSITDSIFSNTYLIDHSKGLLYPLDRSSHLQDKTRWLQITDEEGQTTSYN